MVRGAEHTPNPFFFSYERLTSPKLMRSWSMKLKEQTLVESAIREGVYIGLVKADPAQAALLNTESDIVDEIAKSVMLRLKDILVFDMDFEDYQDILEDNGWSVE